MPITPSAQLEQQNIYDIHKKKKDLHFSNTINYIDTNLKTPDMTQQVAMILI